MFSFKRYLGQIIKLWYVQNYCFSLPNLEFYQSLNEYCLLMGQKVNKQKHFWKKYTLELNLKFEDLTSTIISSEKKPPLQNPFSNLKADSEPAAFQENQKKKEDKEK